MARQDSDVTLTSYGPKELLFKILVIGDYGVGEYEYLVHGIYVRAMEKGEKTKKKKADKQRDKRRMYAPDA